MGVRGIGTVDRVLAGCVLFAALYPTVFPSTPDPAFSLTIENAASTPYTLRLMSWMASIFLPLMLGYQAWSYWVFRRRLGGEPVGQDQLASAP